MIPSTLAISYLYICMEAANVYEYIFVYIILTGALNFFKQE